VAALDGKTGEAVDTALREPVRDMLLIRPRFARVAAEPRDELCDAARQGSGRGVGRPERPENPYACPVYGDFTKGYIPTMIQGGLKKFC
jgi:hypothetical protein